jgi:hypothetical protein
MDTPRWPAIDAHLAPGVMLWFGEVHGTEQSPRFFGDVATYAARTWRVQLGLELPRDMQTQVDAYLRSDGEAAAQAALLDGVFWRWEDGRSSDAMLALLERIRALRAAGTRIDIVAFDVRTDDECDANTRDAAMAVCLNTARDDAAVLIVLSGSNHARRTSGAWWDPDFVPAAAQLVARGLPIKSFDVAASGGTHWGIVGDIDSPRCGVHEIGVAAPGEPWTLGPSHDDAFDGVYFVGMTTASLPVRR